MATLMGVLTGIGGGMARYVLLAEIPTVLHAGLYPVAALAGAAIVVLTGIYQIPAGPTALIGALLCFCLRILALKERLATTRR